MYRTTDVVARTGASERQLQRWADTQGLPVTARVGHHHRWSDRDLTTATGVAGYVLDPATPTYGQSHRRPSTVLRHVDTWALDPAPQWLVVAHRDGDTQCHPARTADEVAALVAANQGWVTTVVPLT